MKRNNATNEKKETSRKTGTQLTRIIMKQCLLKNTTNADLLYCTNTKKYQD